RRRERLLAHELAQILPESTPVEPEGHVGVAQRTQCQRRDGEADRAGEQESVERVVPIGPVAEHEGGRLALPPEISELGDEELLVRVDLENPLPTSELETADDRRAMSRVALGMVDMEPLSILGEAVENARALVRRAVVDHDDLERQAEPDQITLEHENEVANPRSLVVYGHDAGQAHRPRRIPVSASLLPAEGGDANPHGLQHDRSSRVVLEPAS